MILNILGNFFIIVGSLFLFLGGLGVIRMPDTFNRLQAGTKASTLGAMSVLLGVGLLIPGWLPKLIVFILFIVLTNPISSHAIIRATYILGNRDNLNVDEYKGEKK